MAIATQKGTRLKGLAVLAIVMVTLLSALRIPAVEGELRCYIQHNVYPAYAPGPVPLGTPVIEAAAETPPVRDKCDAADDPAIWINRQNPSLSLVLGTNKQRGLNVYSLDGRLVATHALGKINNVDVRELALSSEQSRVIVGASNKGASRLEIWELIPGTGAIWPILTRPIEAQVEEETYGFCFYRSQETQTLYAFATDKSGAVEQWALHAVPDGRLSPEFIRKLRVPSQPEGCVGDDANARLFVGEEDVGIWAFDAEPNGDLSGALIARTGSKTGDDFLTADVEGLAVYAPPGADPAQGYLIASSQGSASYAVFDRAPPYEYRGAFQIAFGGEKVGDTDGLDVTAANLGGAFTSGMLVVQDGLNARSNGEDANQNFKFIAWTEIEEQLQLLRR